MKKQLMDILACPICKSHPLNLYIFKEGEDIVEGLIVCPFCDRWYPIIDEIPHMLPDELRNSKEDVAFIIKWKKKIPKTILEKGKPFNEKNI